MAGLEVIGAEWSQSWSSGEGHLQATSRHRTQGEAIIQVAGPLRGSPLSTRAFSFPPFCRWCSWRAISVLNVSACNITKGHLLACHYLAVAISFPFLHWTSVHRTHSSIQQPLSNAVSMEDVATRQRPHVPLVQVVVQANDTNIAVVTATGNLLLLLYNGSRRSLSLLQIRPHVHHILPRQSKS